MKRISGCQCGRGNRSILVNICSAGPICTTDENTAGDGSGLASRNAESYGQLRQSEYLIDAGGHTVNSRGDNLPEVGDEVNNSPPMDTCTSSEQIYKKCLA